MTETTVRGRILKWGNSYAIRLTKRDLERSHLKVGQDVEATIRAEPGKVDYSDAGFLRGGEPDVSQEHDRWLVKAAEEEVRGWRKKGRDA